MDNGKPETQEWMISHLEEIWGLEDIDFAPKACVIYKKKTKILIYRISIISTPAPKSDRTRKLLWNLDCTQLPIMKLSPPQMLDIFYIFLKKEEE